MQTVKEVSANFQARLNIFLVNFNVCVDLDAMSFVQRNILLFFFAVKLTEPCKKCPRP